MIYTFAIALTAAYIVPTWSNPVDSNALVATIKHRRDARQDKLDALTKEFPGIFWDRAYKECKSDQLAILEETTRVAEEYMTNVLSPPTDNPNGQGSANTVAWDMFFVKPGRATKDDWTTTYRDQYDSIWHNMKQASTFPYKGHQKNDKRPKEEWRLTYHCDGLGLNEHKCKTEPNVAAYTENPQLTGTGWAVTFCSKFFQGKYLKKITEGTQSKQLNNLISYEHTLVHEFMHVGLFGHKYEIIDMDESGLKSNKDTKVKVYGVQRCQEFATLDLDSKAHSVNPKVGYNADNYAWWCTKKWFDDKWHNNPTKFKLKRDAPDDKGPNDNGGIQYYNTISSDQIKLVPGSPKDCSKPPDCGGCDNSAPICSYIGEPYEDYDPGKQQSSAPLTPLPAPVAPYAQGICSFHLTQWASVLTSDPYSIEIRLKDNNGAQIGYQAKATASDSKPLRVGSKLKDIMFIRPESQKDYVAFTLGAQAWPSSQKNGVPSCTVGGWDSTDIPAYRQMDCRFTCQWGGGKSSDGS